MPSLAAARRNASLATDSLSAADFKEDQPGTDDSHPELGGPLPLPIRVSGGRVVTGLCGKIRIQTLPLRFKVRLIATRQASICWLVTQARPSACNPNSPKSMVVPRVAFPARLPRWALRNLVLLGINGISLKESCLLVRCVRPRAVGAVSIRLGSPRPPGRASRVSRFCDRFGLFLFRVSQHLTPMMP